MVPRHTVNPLRLGARGMGNDGSIWHPHYTLTPAIARGLMEIEAAKAVVERTPLSPAAEAELRYRARLRSTHFSTRIEGNRLTLAETRAVIEASHMSLPERQRDVAEVRAYWDALLRVEEWAAAQRPLTEDLIHRLHARVEYGPRARPTPYRDGQNVIRDTATGTTVYMPPVAKDVPNLMAALVAWANAAARDRLPMPLIAGLLHYQFVTIHPFYDGNGRTARLLATFVLHRGGYGLNGYFSLEEHHARDLAAYYDALATHPQHNYYDGRADTDLTSWTEYFIGTLARVFTLAREEAERSSARGVTVEPDYLRRLDHRARIVLSLFARSDQINARDVAGTLRLSDRSARALLNQWVNDGWLTIANPSNRARSYALSAEYRQVVGKSSADIDAEHK